MSNCLKNVNITVFYVLLPVYKFIYKHLSLIPSYLLALNNPDKRLYLNNHNRKNQLIFQIDRIHLNKQTYFTYTNVYYIIFKLFMRRKYLNEDYFTKG